MPVARIVQYAAVPKSRTAPSPRAPSAATIGLGLAILTLVALGGVLSCGFIDLDDGIYVTQNPMVLKGLTRTGVVWAFTTTTAANWHPLTWLSLMLDASLGGADPRIFHATNLVLHLANTLLLFDLLRRTTARAWPSALAAALFAVHPLHVESVAWVVERKDLLSTLFGLLAVSAYVRHVERPGWKTYALIATSYTASLMAKPMLVTLPFLLILFDVWPLRRAPNLREKVPLFVLSAGSCVATLAAQRAGGAVEALSAVPVATRMSNSVLSYATYLTKAIWPTSLGVFYPLSAHGAPIGKVAVSLLVLASITAAAVALRKRVPYLFVGWLWYVISLVPVIGWIQVGAQAMADRYTYVPLIGIFIIAAFGLAELGTRRKPLASAAGAAAVLALTLVTRAQVGYWADTSKLFTHALAVTSDNWMAHDVLGQDLAARGRTDEAIAHFRAAVSSKPDYGSALLDLGIALDKSGRSAEAAGIFERALRVNPQSAAAHLGAANALAASGRLDAAIGHYREVVRLLPGSAQAHHSLAVALARGGTIADAIAQYEEALRLRPGDGGWLNDLGLALARSNRLPEAIERFEEAARAQPSNAEIFNNLGVAFAQSNRLAEAAKQFRRALAIDPSYAAAQSNLERAQASTRSP